MKLTSKAFSKWYLEKDFQSIKLYDESGKQPEKFKSIQEAAGKIMELRIQDESEDTMDVADYIQLENKVREEVMTSIDPTGYLVQQARQRGILPQEA